LRTASYVSQTRWLRAELEQTNRRVGIDPPIILALRGDRHHRHQIALRGACPIPGRACPSVVCSERSACGGPRRRHGGLRGDRGCTQHDWAWTCGIAQRGDATFAPPPPSGRGRRPKIETGPGLLEALGDLVQSAIRGDPEAALLWVSKSQRHLAGALAERGFTASQKFAGRLLGRLGFSLQANSKVREGTSHPNRNAQFAYVNAQVGAFRAAGQPTILVATKKKELVGDFKNGGRELRSKGEPEPVRVHDFVIPELGKVAPYSVYDIAVNAGWINLGINHDTAAFAVESIRRWWQELIQARYHHAKRLLITADCGGSNGARVRLWKAELQALADQTGLSITVAHLPPGTSKWNHPERRPGPGQIDRPPGLGECQCLSELSCNA